jgi:hypothetical protein
VPGNVAKQGLTPAGYSPSGLWKWEEREKEEENGWGRGSFHSSFPAAPKHAHRDPQAPDDAKLAVVVLVQTLSASPTYECLDTQFLLQFPCKAIFDSFAALDLTSWKLPESCELFPTRSASKQNTTVPANDRGSDNFLARHVAQVVIFAPGRDRLAPSATVVCVEKGKVALALASRKEIALTFAFGAFGT